MTTCANAHCRKELPEGWPRKYCGDACCKSAGYFNNLEKMRQYSRERRADQRQRSGLRSFHSAAPREPWSVVRARIIAAHGVKLDERQPVEMSNGIKHAIKF